MKKSTAGCGYSFALVWICWAGIGLAPAQNPTQSGAGNGTQAATTAAPSTVTQNPTLAQGLAELQANRARPALTDFQQVLKSDPNNTAANLLASTAAVELYQGQLAVQYAEKARQLDPRNWKIHTTLVAAYSAAGMKEQRDQERALLEQLHKIGAPDARQATGFLVEMFPQGAYRVDAVEYFEPMGKFHTYYRFLVRQADGRRVWEVDVESDEFDEQSWAAAHPAEAASGNRQFQITGRGDNNQSVEYRNFSGKPDYDNIRVMVVEILRSRSFAAAEGAAAH
jgi:tetratricopeptide (TPR) repeat protein